MQSDIENKCERGLVYHLNQSAGLISGVTIVTGVNPGTQDLPQITVQATGSEEYPLFSGNYMVNVDVLVRSNADDTSRETHNSRVGVVREELLAPWTGASVSSHLTNFTVLKVLPTDNRTAADDRSWVTTLGVRIPCRPS